MPVFMRLYIKSYKVVHFATVRVHFRRQTDVSQQLFYMSALNQYD